MTVPETICLILLGLTACLLALCVRQEKDIHCLNVLNRQMEHFVAIAERAIIRMEKRENETAACAEEAVDAVIREEIKKLEDECNADEEP